MHDSMTLGIQVVQHFSDSLTGLALIIPALFWLFFADRQMCSARGTDASLMRRTGWLALAPLLLFTAPVSSSIIYGLLSGSSLKSCFLAVPTVLICAYAAVELSVFFGAFSWTLRRQAALYLCLILVILAGISRPWKFSLDGIGLTSNSMKINRNIPEICEVIGSSKTLMPVPLRAQIREYQPEANPVINTRYYETVAGSMAKVGKKSKSRYVVIKKDFDNPAVFARHGFSKCADTQDYTIYKR